jgi:hypothetical protein
MGFWMVLDGVVVAIVILALVVLTSDVVEGFGFALAVIGLVVFKGSAVASVFSCFPAADGSVVDMFCTLARTILCMDTSDATDFDR